MPDPRKPTPPDPAANQRQDEAVEDSFPASDPPSNTGTTGPGRPDRPAPKPPTSRPRSSSLFSAPPRHSMA